MVEIASVGVATTSIKAIHHIVESTRIHRLSVAVVASVRDRAAMVVRDRFSVEGIAAAEEIVEPVHSGYNVAPGHCWALTHRVALVLVAFVYGVGRGRRVGGTIVLHDCCSVGMYDFDIDAVWRVIRTLGRRDG